MRSYRTVFASCLFVLLCWQGGAAQADPEIGWWWNPAEAGRGFFIESHNGFIFLAGYLYADDGRATWVVAGEQNADPYNYTGQLLSFNHGQTLFGDYALPAAVIPNGQVTVHFSDDTHGTLTWPGGTISLEREYFDGAVAPFQPIRGWWWNPAESGRGFSIELEGNNLFMVGFMYDDSGNPVWYLSSGTMSTPRKYSGSLLQLSGGQTMTGPYHFPTAQKTVGNVDIEFTATDQATMTFTEAPSASGMQAQAGRSKMVVITTEFPLPAYKLPFSYTGDLQATHTQDDVVQQSGVAQTIHTRRVTQGSGLKWQRQSAANIDGDGRPTGTYTLVGGTFAVTLTQTQHTAVGDFAGDCTRTGTAQLSAAAVGKNAVLTVNGYGDYGIDMDLSVLDLLIATTTMTCTFSNGDSSGPLPAGPEGGIVQFLNVNSVSWTPPDGLGVIAWSTATPRVLGTGKYSGSYVFIEDQ